MIDGSKSEPPFCVRLWLKKIEKKIVCRKVLLEKNCLQRCIDKKKFAERDFSSPPPPPPSRKIMVRPLVQGLQDCCRFYDSIEYFFFVIIWRFLYYFFQQFLFLYLSFLFTHLFFIYLFIIFNFFVQIFF